MVAQARVIWDPGFTAYNFGPTHPMAPLRLDLTARLALDLGRELWVVPGSPEDPGAEGPNFLLREGAARICLSPEDLLEDLSGHWVT
mgnify:CR=1 FL=1